MESFREFIVPITIFLVAIWVAVWKEKSRLKSLGRKINEDSYQRYAKFYGNTIPKDANFINQIKIIYYSIVKDGETDVKKIAEKANCTYTDCILKIRYLKNKRKLADYYYIDEVNGIINKCSKEDQMLLNKYKLYIYNNHFQIDEIAAKLPGSRAENQEEIKEKVFQELCYLDDKDLINGIILNRVDRTITYYSVEKHRKIKDKITMNCPNCGALNELNKGSKIKCEYCGSIIEDELEIEDIDNEIKS